MLFVMPFLFKGEFGGEGDARASLRLSRDLSVKRGAFEDLKVGDLREVLGSLDDQ
ncbi:hypothetical protein [Kolteria novifilia]|uniref:hypothetical protein n=1 Tax=Kolteria novifilia TaxID=2527975 RepID=UPI003AF37883